MDDLDRLLSSDDAVTPSPRFAAHVMDAIAAAAAEPPPLPFPWRRFAAGLAACAAWAACGVWLAQSGSLSIFADPVAALGSVTTELEYAAATIAGGLVTLRVLKVRADA